MARNTIRYGSRGNDVRDLQNLLNESGYKLNADGIFGSATQNAVRDYQKKNGLGVDGIVGANTWGKLSPEAKPTAPSGYQSPYADSIKELMGQMDSRKPFDYNLNADMMYQMYKAQAMRNGAQAMKDTIGQATALTGGYDNSFANTAGQQAYNAHLDSLNDRIPSLMEAARNVYDREGQDLKDRLGLLLNMDDREYGKYRDQVADKQWKTQFDEQVRQHNESMARRSSGGGGGGKPYNMSASEYGKWQKMWSEVGSEADAEALMEGMVQAGVPKEMAFTFFDAFMRGETPGMVDTTVTDKYRQNWHGGGGAGFQRNQALYKR